MTPRPVRVVVAPRVAEFIAERAQQAAPKETGGLLLGWWEDTTVVAGHAVEVPDPDATTSTWTRHEQAAQAALETALRDLSHPWLGYVGDWHSHPATADPSPTDEQSLRRASTQYTKPLALLVHQPNDRLHARVAHQGHARAARLNLQPSSGPPATLDQQGEPDAFTAERRSGQPGTGK
jgi:integrative and conjugative element protein (TIGR02256 family)